jgi:hypothetical protein
MGGVGVQQFFILVFFFYAIKFHRIILQQIRQGIEGVSNALPLLYAIYAVLTLITVRHLIPLTSTATFVKMRIIFRLVEYSHGFKSNIPSHEAYQYGLDSVPMLFALVILNFIHPGRIMPGKESDLPSRKERKAEGIHNKSENVSGRIPLHMGNAPLPYAPIFHDHGLLTNTAPSSRSIASSSSPC